MTENDKVLKYYHDFLITPVASTLASLTFKVISASDEFNRGIPFGLLSDDCLEKAEKSIFPNIIHDWKHIQKRIDPLIKNVMEAVSCQT